MLLYSTNTNPELARKVAQLSHLRLGHLEIKKFSDGEIYIRPKEKIREKAVWIIGSTMPPADNLLKLLILLNALKTNGAKKINAIIPYFGYARQDWIDQPNAPLTAKLMADLLAAAGADKFFTFNLHSKQNVKFFTKPLVHLSAYPVLVDHFKKLHLTNLMIFSPDQGGIHRAEQFANFFTATRGGLSSALPKGGGQTSAFPKIGYCEKYRPRPNVAKITLPKKFNVRGKNIILVDDMIDTAGTLCGAAEALKKAGAHAIYAAAAHGIFSGPAIARIKKSPIKRMIITDTFPVPKEKRIPKVKIISVAPLLKNVIASESQSYRDERGNPVKTLLSFG